MHQHSHKQGENSQKSVAASVGEKSNAASGTSLEDNREESVAQLKLREAHTLNAAAVQLKSGNTQAAAGATQQENPVQKKANGTGLPDQLKSGIENLSGYSMDDVKVHYHSSKPAQLQAYAFAQGTSIHLATGQEKHLPHEAWHVVQQKQGRVKPTIQMKGVQVNDNTSLEKEADLMGAKALGAASSSGKTKHTLIRSTLSSGTAVLQGAFIYYGQAYAYNPNPHIQWFRAADGHYYPAPAQMMHMPPPPQAYYQPPAQQEYRPPSQQSSLSATAAEYRPPKAPFKPAPMGALPTASVESGSSAKEKERETPVHSQQQSIPKPSSSIQPPPQRNIRDGKLLVKGDGFQIKTRSLLEPAPIDVPKDVVIPVGFKDGDTVRFEWENQRIVRVLPKPAEHVAAVVHQLGIIRGADRIVTIISIEAPERARIIFQAGYMSGDRYGVAAALQLHDDLGIMILFNSVGDPKADELYKFYEGVAKPGQLGRCITGDSQALYRILNDVPEQRAAFGEMGHFGGQLLPLGTGTKLVAESFGEDVEGSRKKVVSGWFGDKASIDKGNGEIRNWLRDTIHMPPGNYALLWVKSGKATDEKSYHYTDPAAWEQIIRNVRGRTGRIPVLIGEPLAGIQTNPSLVKFWERGFPGAKRIDQQRLFHFFNVSGDYNVVNIGMKSGATEGPALVGLPTIYLEEAHNAQAGRMEQWLHTLPNFMRVILDAPPGDMQKESLAAIWSKDVAKQGQSRLKGYGSEGAFIQHMQKASAALLRMQERKGLSDDEEAAIMHLMSIPPATWNGLKAVEFNPEQGGPSRFSRVNTSHETNFKTSLEDEDGIVARSPEIIEPQLHEISAQLETAAHEAWEGFAKLIAELRKYISLVSSRFKHPESAKAINAAIHEQAGVIQDEINRLHLWASENDVPRDQKDKILQLTNVKVRTTYLWMDIQ